MPSRLLGLVRRYASIARVNRFAEGAVLIVGGAFLLRPELRECWDLLVWLHISFDEMVARAVERDVAWAGEPEPVRHRTRTIGPRCTSFTSGGRAGRTAPTLSSTTRTWAASSAAPRSVADVTDHSAVVVYIDADRGLAPEPAGHCGYFGVAAQPLAWLALTGPGTWALANHRAS